MITGLIQELYCSSLRGWEGALSASAHATLPSHSLYIHPVTVDMIPLSCMVMSHPRLPGAISRKERDTRTFFVFCLQNEESQSFCCQWSYFFVLIQKDVFFSCSQNPELNQINFVFMVKRFITQLYFPCFISSFRRSLLLSKPTVYVNFFW